jgi:outer membrane protein OmpA-like peptidoglycan-associated protein
MQTVSEIANAALPNDALERLSAALHEDPSAVRRGLDYALPASVAGLQAYASSDARAERLLATLREGDYPFVSAAEVRHVVGDREATARLSRSSRGFIDRVLGDRGPAVIDAIAHRAGLSRASASTMLGLATPLVLHGVGEEAAARRLDAPGLSRFLSEQKELTFDALPAQVALALHGEDALGAETPAQAGAPRAEVGPLHDVREPGEGLPHVGAEPRRYPRHGTWWKLAALGVVVLAALFMVGRRNARPEFAGFAPAHDVKHAQWPQQQGDQLAQTQEPSVAEGRTDDDKQAGAPTKAISAHTGTGQLVAVLDGHGALPKRFVLEQSDAAIGQAAEALNAHPSAKVRLDAFADRDGDAMANLRRSEARAARVRQALVAHGVAERRIEINGEPGDRPLASNLSAAGLARNQRVELVVTAR